MQSYQVKTLEKLNVTQENKYLIYLVYLQISLVTWARART